MGASGAELPGPFWTGTVSAGGMYFHVGPEAGAALAAGTDLSFTLTVPPGGGYSASAGTVRGSGRILRIEPVGEGVVGVAVHFSRPLSIDFQGASA